eukprot:UN19309
MTESHSRDSVQLDNILVKIDDKNNNNNHSAPLILETQDSAINVDTIIESNVDNLNKDDNSRVMLRSPTVDTNVDLNSEESFSEPNTDILPLQP